MQLAVYPELIEEISPHRAQVINAASEICKFCLSLFLYEFGRELLVEKHPDARDASRKRLKKSARKHMETGIESQKVGASNYVLMALGN